MPESNCIGIDSRIHPIDPVFIHRLNEFTHDLALIERDIDVAGPPKYEDAIHRRLLETVEASVDACKDFERAYGHDKDLLLDTQKLFRRETDPWFRQCWIANRARSKPSGFAGDYEMLVKLYEHKTPAVGIGAYLDLICLYLPLACAVRGRLDMAREFLLEEVRARQSCSVPVRILDIASGPCREFLEWPSTTHPVDVVALDNDPNAIEYVQSTVIPGITSPSRLDCVSYNAFRTRSSETTIKKFGRFDVLYSVGLCDYLTDDVLIKLLAAWDETLSDNGVMFIAFKDTRRYDQTIYQWHLDWFFYQRTISDVFELYERAGFDLGSIATRRDETGVITSFITRRDPSRIRRVDAAETTIRKPTLRLFGPRPLVLDGQVESPIAAPTNPSTSS